MTAPLFMLATGIENSYPTIHNGRRRIDEMDKCGHYTHWRTDFDLLEDVNVHTLRYGPPIHTPGSDRGATIGSSPTLPSARCTGATLSRSWTSATSACRTGSGTFRTRTSPSSSPGTPA